jgi:hypothetical protein
MICLKNRLSNVECNLRFQWICLCVFCGFPCRHGEEEPKHVAGLGHNRMFLYIVQCILIFEMHLSICETRPFLFQNTNVSLM